MHVMERANLFQVDLFDACFFVEVVRKRRVSCPWRRWGLAPPCPGRAGGLVRAGGGGGGWEGVGWAWVGRLGGLGRGRTACSHQLLDLESKTTHFPCPVTHILLLSLFITHLYSNNGPVVDNNAPAMDASQIRGDEASPAEMGSTDSSVISAGGDDDSAGGEDTEAGEDAAENGR